MKLKVLGSSSKGNCYILDNGYEAIVIEAGVPFIQVCQAMQFDTYRIKAVIVSHEHGDHAKYIQEYLNAYIPVYVTNTDSCRYKHSMLRQHKMDVVSKLGGGFMYVPFLVKHDVECSGFYLYHKEMGFMLFATDTPYLSVSFDIVNHLLIEANYSSRKINANLKRGDISEERMRRVILNHMSIDTAIETAERLNTGKLRNVVLLHLSDDNSDEDLFRCRMKYATGIHTTVAKKGVVINVSKEVF